MSTPAINAAKARFGSWYVAAAVALVLFKLWLVSAQTITAVGYANHDDALFITLARHILGGRWLGAYNELTLAKGPMYSLFIAGVFLLGIPLFLAQQLLYATACASVVKALRPMVPQRGLCLALFAVLLFNPVTYDSIVHSRILRQNILHSLVLFIIAGLIALYARREQPKRRLLPWVLVTGLALPAFWLTREEGVWLMPCVCLIWLLTAVKIWLLRTSDRYTRLGLLAVPGIMWIAGLSIISGINWYYYGVFTTCEFRQADFKAAFGSLLRVEPVQWQPFLPITRESRERIYAVSPAFAELRPILEGSSGEGWAGSSECATHRPAKEHEIAVGWFMWALRDAVFTTGHAPSGGAAAAYYAQLAREVNDACERGLLKAGPRRTGFLQPLRKEQFQPFLTDSVKAAWYFLSFDGMSAVTQDPSGGSEDELERFSDLTRGRLSPPRDSRPTPKRQLWLDGIRRGLLEQIVHAYQRVAPWAGGLSFLLLLCSIGVALVRKNLPYFAVFSLGLLGSCLAINAIVALIGITSFPSLNTGYFTGAYALWLLFLFAGWFALAESLKRKPSAPIS